MYNQNVAREQPFVSAGTNALPGLLKMLGLDSSGNGTPSSPILNMLGLGTGGTGQIDPTKFQSSPGYQYQLQQGLNGVTNSYKGNIGGNALRELQSTGQGLANQGWNQYLSNASGAYQNLVGNVSNVVGSGQGTQVANQVGSNLIGAGNATAAGITGSANSTTSGLTDVSKTLSGLLNSSAFQNLFKSGGGSYSSIDPNGTSVAPNTWSSQPDSAYLPGGSSYYG
jgi:hypothetical protein